ncbi:hypothetical protein CTEN210_18043 [Chaetoceros tenuissimus]|uniref:Uncharacterized protein n=1 Tax=Chaetoceros tenuissimus TaxID=426638 RepID=A0AAD3DCQ5_9STRA|nr:hypothetical protein CTEN210_18043 [Chaetoceros tenuissimus]
MHLPTRGKVSSRKKMVTSLIFTCAIFVYFDFLQPTQVSRYLTSNQVDLSEFQIDTFPLIHSDVPTDEELLSKVKESKGETDNEDFDEEATRISIDQMFYMNLDEDIEKSKKMEDWLSWFLPNRGIPFYRLPLMKGLPYVCDFEDEEKCIRESGKVDTLLHLMQSNEYNTRGTSLNLQDDVEITDMHKLRLAANLVPDDWDVIRFDCSLESDNSLPNLNNYVFQTNQGREIRPFLDNSRIMLLRDDKFEKIADAINILPRQELDAALSFKKINSYCVNVGIGHRFEIKPSRPISYTFFSPLHKEDQHDDMIDVWKKEWEMAGFEPRILTIEDAMKNPYFDTMKEEVEKVFSADIYNAYCLYRYLAIANVGGIMSDYDTMPLYLSTEEANTLVNDGKFTSYERHVPSLISASKEEWQRVAQLLTEQISKSDSWLKSDMLLLREVGRDPSNDVNLDSGRSILGRVSYIKGEKQNVDCNAVHHKRAIHISHASVDWLQKRADEFGIDPNLPRTKVAETYMNDFREQFSRYFASSSLARAQYCFSQKERNQKSKHVAVNTTGTTIDSPQSEKEKKTGSVEKQPSTVTTNVHRGQLSRADTLPTSNRGKDKAAVSKGKKRKKSSRKVSSKSKRKTAITREDWEAGKQIRFSDITKSTSKVSKKKQQKDGSDDAFDLLDMMNQF